jgi:hypothetical protein
LIVPSATLILERSHLKFVLVKTSTENGDGKRLEPIGQHTTSDQVHRIVPLGLTLGEARAWYINHVLMPRLRWASLAIVAGLIILLSMLSQLGELLDETLTTHMIVQHFLFITVGFLFAYAGYSLIEVAPQFSYRASQARDLVKRANLNANVVSILMFAAAASLIAFSYFPAQLDAAALNVNVHVEMRITLLSAGGLIFVGSHFLSKRLRLIAPLIVGKAMGLYGMFLLLTPFDVYAVYPVYEQAYTGVVLLILMLVLDFTVMPLWLYNYFGKTAAVNAAALE